MYTIHHVVLNMFHFKFYHKFALYYNIIKYGIVIIYGYDIICASIIPNRD